MSIGGALPSSVAIALPSVLLYSVLRLGRNCSLWIPRERYHAHSTASLLRQATGNQIVARAVDMRSIPDHDDGLFGVSNVAYAC